MALGASDAFNGTSVQHKHSAFNTGPATCPKIARVYSKMCSNRHNSCMMFDFQYDV
jgi:hypothetical protein